MVRNSPSSSGFVALDDSSHQQQTTPTEHDLESPPPYSSALDQKTPSKVYVPLQAQSSLVADNPPKQ
jgi:hypothetical protein